ncbi:MAG: cytochrome b N-terminal domain-containing protein [Thermoanaerobaculia bacterium]
MSLLPKKGFWDRLFWSWRPQTDREAGEAVVANFLLHWFPNRVTLKSLALGYSLYLGTILMVLFGILTLTGVILMFLYVPSVERAYWGIKDLDYAVSFGWFLRRVHRISAHLMVAAVFLHMFRVFLTGSYKKGSAVGSNRPFNWVLGVVLLILTLFLSFTGYLLPWDQLAFWAITVGTNIAASVPLVGDQIREFLLGGTLVGQNTLIRFYVLHVVFLPLALFGVAVWHMWRIRKDGGLAVVEQLREQNRETAPAPPEKTKTWSVLGIASGASVTVMDPSTVREEDSVPSSPFLTTRLLAVSAVTLIVVMLLSLFVAAPLEQPANPEVTPNPAKAPWYFLGLQELVGYSALIGGVVIPGIVLLGLALIPYLDREQRRIGYWLTDSPGRRWSLVGVLWGTLWTVGCLAFGIRFPMRALFPNIESQLFFDLVNPASLLLLSFVILYFLALKITSSTRTAAIATFCAFIVAFVLLTWTGTMLRGPNWEFFWPWQPWPTHPIPF